MRLTKANISKLQLPPGKTDLLVFDDEIPGFGLRLRAGGKRTWVAQYRIGTKQRRLSLGSASSVDAEEARKRAKKALAAVQLGTDPQTAKSEARVQAAATLGKTIETYLRWVKPRLKPDYFSDLSRYLRVHWAPLHEIPVQNITRPLVASRLTDIATERGLYSSNRARAALSSFYSWAIGEGVSDNNPVTGTNKATEEISRDRVLSDVELRMVWQNSGPDHFGLILRLLILTAQRESEVGGMLRSELALPLKLWNIGADRTKNRLPHDVPLTDDAIAIIRELPQVQCRDLVFGHGQGPFQGWSHAKAALDERINNALAVCPSEGAFTKPWRLHDLRRTAATRMGDIGVQPHIIEAVINHVSGHKAGVAGVYNRALYAPEKRAALTAWGEYVSNLVGRR